MTQSQRMTRGLALLGALMLAGALATAQDTTTGSSQSTTTSSSSTSTTQNNSPTGQNTTVQGCLSSSSMGDNAYTLTQDQTGTVYTLTGNTDELKSHVGHEIAVTGQLASSSASETAGSTAPSGTASGNQPGASATSDTGNNSLQVNSVQMISDHCASTGTPGPTGGATTGADTDQPTATNSGMKTGSAVMDNSMGQTAVSSSPAAVPDQGAPATPTSTDPNTSSSMMAQNTTPTSTGAPQPSAATNSRDHSTAQDASGNLPPTSTFLPLLGLLGLGSLIAGLFVRR